MTEQRSDADLAAAAATGDRDALGILVVRHTPRVYALCHRIMGNHHDAEDATQEVLVTVARRVGSFEGRAAFSTWLHRVTVNTCTDLIRRRGRQPVTAAWREDAAHPDHAVADLLAAREVDASLQAALAQLEPAQRRAVVLFDVGGWSHREIAEHEGVAVGTVKSRVHRGHARLAEALRELNEVGEPSVPLERRSDHG